jgi:hypothetical protein
VVLSDWQTSRMVSLEMFYQLLHDNMIFNPTHRQTLWNLQRVSHHYSLNQNYQLKTITACVIFLFIFRLFLITSIQTCDFSQNLTIEDVTFIIKAEQKSQCFHLKSFRKERVLIFQQKRRERWFLSPFLLISGTPFGAISFSKNADR